MTRHSSLELTKKTLGAFALIALMSIFVAKFFSELALADSDNPATAIVHAAPTAGAPARNLGTYRVVDVVDHAHYHNGSACHPFRDANGEMNEPDRECGRYVWLARTDNQLAMIEMPHSPEDDDNLDAFMLYGSKCDSFISSAQFRTSITDSKLCRAFHVRSLDRGNNETFVFNDGVDPMATAIETSMLTMAVTGIPLGVGDSFSISVPKSQSVPDRVVITKTISGSFMFIVNTSLTKDIILQRVAE